MAITLRESKLYICLFFAGLLAACGGSSGGGETTAKSGYVVGDTGPNGGLIFYVDSNDDYYFSYLEAAPAPISIRTGSSTTVLFMWASSAGGAAYSIPGTSTFLGQGKSNTATIAESLTEDGQAGRAVHRTLEFELGECEWFLPSKDELNRMYLNLVQTGLADVPGGFYWSSSQASRTQAWAQSMSLGGAESSLEKGQANRVWPVCAF